MQSYQEKILFARDIFHKFLAPPTRSRSGKKCLENITSMHPRLLAYLMHEKAMHELYTKFINPGRRGKKTGGESLPESEKGFYVAQRYACDDRL
jgi:hypothetical protein